MYKRSIPATEAIIGWLLIATAKEVSAVNYTILATEAIVGWLSIATAR